MELIKQIMIILEENEPIKMSELVNSESLTEYDQEEIIENCITIAGAELVKWEKDDSGECYFKYLTWKGHDFIDNARNSTVWKVAMKSAGKLSFGVFQQALEQSAVSYALKKLDDSF